MIDVFLFFLSIYFVRLVLYGYRSVTCVLANNSFHEIVEYPDFGLYNVECRMSCQHDSTSFNNLRLTLHVLLPFTLQMLNVECPAIATIYYIGLINIS